MRRAKGKDGEKVGRGREEGSWTYSYDIRYMLLPRDNDDPLKKSVICICYLTKGAKQAKTDGKRGLLTFENATTAMPTVMCAIRFPVVAPFAPPRMGLLSLGPALESLVGIGLDDEESVFSFISAWAWAWPSPKVKSWSHSLSCSFLSSSSSRLLFPALGLNGKGE